MIKAFIECYLSGVGSGTSGSTWVTDPASYTLKAVSRYDANYVITGGTSGYHNDNPRCPPVMTKLVYWSLSIFDVKVMSPKTHSKD